MRALSISSWEMFMKNDRSTSTLKTLTALGRISARYVSVSPSACTSR